MFEYTVLLEIFCIFVISGLICSLKQFKCLNHTKPLLNYRWIKNEHTRYSGYTHPSMQKYLTDTPHWNLNLWHGTLQTKATGHRVTFVCLHCPRYLISLIFQIAGPTCPKKKWKREHKSVCDRWRHRSRGDIFYCHCVCQVLTRWQCSVGILFDKFY